jgi:transposase
MDGAGWHKSKNLIIPKNIQVVFLPPYSPQLNPVERLWKFIKEQHNKK